MAHARRDRRPLLMAAIYVLLLLAGLVVEPRARQAICQPVLVASSNEKFVLVSRLAADYSRAHQEQAWAGCGPVVRVERVASGDAEAELADGWPDESMRPQVWMPAATTWGYLLQQRLAAKRAHQIVPPPGTWRSIASSPLVVAMPDKMARALGWPNVQPSWKDLLDLAANPAGWGARGHPEWGAFRLGKTDPDVSTSGIHALIAEYYAGTGKSSNLTAADLTASATTNFVAGVEASVSHYAPTAGDFLTNVAAAGDAASFISAIPVEEQEVFNYNEGRYSPDGLPPRDPLDAVYPAGGTLKADHPAIVLVASWVSKQQRSTADKFIGWLQDPDRQLAFEADGFRSLVGAAGPDLAGEPGILSREPAQTLNPPAPAVVAAIRSSWATTFRKPARILLVLDLDSDQQRSAVLRAVASLSDGDQVGATTTTPGPRAPVSTLVTTRPAIEAAIRTAPLRAGPTRLYTTIDSAYKQMDSSADPSRINAVVVIAAGRDDGGGLRLTDLERHVRTKPGGTPVRIYTVALGSSDRKALSGIERASGGYATSSQDATAAIRACLANL